MKGFTLIEFLLVSAIVTILIGLSTINLFNFQHKSQLSSTVNVLFADIKEQQTKAMVGDTEGRSANDTYGINFASTKYILFHGTFSSIDSSNFTVTLPNTIQVTTTFPNSQLIFTSGSGAVSGYTSSNATITLRDIVQNTQTVITVNRYGVITAVN